MAALPVYEGVMALTKFVRNLEDLSDDGGYKFRFRCDRCSDGFESQYESSSANVLKTAVQVFSIFTHFGYGANRVVEGLDRGLRGQEHDAAYERAVHEATNHFNKCSLCGLWVCPEHCWNAERGLCEGCAPNLHEAAVHSEALREAAAAREPGAGGGAGRGATKLKAASCAGCGLQLKAESKFCESCGVAVGSPHCRHCAAEISLSARFCGQCGGAQV
jgi:hypothetical protein